MWDPGYAPSTGAFTPLYVSWLYNYVDIQDHDGYGYILDHLLATPFKYTIQLDKNTEFYGLELRREFFDYSGELAMTDDNYPCSLLEALIAIAQRIQWNIFWDPEIDNSHLWFWAMLNNLGLGEARDSSEIIGICEQLLNRTYSPTGAGALCGPIGDKNVDIREMPFYAQCELWVVKNYFSQNTIETY